MRTLKSLLTLICIVLFSSTSQAEDINNPQLNRGVKLFNEKRYTEATRLLIPLAEAENETALKLMSQAYQYGRGVPENKQKPLELLRKAAAIESDGWANYALGMFHLKGSSGAKKDEQLGLSYIERANELRHTGAFEVLEANFPGKYSLGQRGTKHQESNPSKRTIKASGEVPLAAGSIFEGKNPCPGQDGLVQILIESIQNKTTPGPVAVDATISFDFNRSKINKPVTAKYFPGQGKLALYNAGPTMRPSDELSETLSLEVTSDGRYLSGNFVAPNTLENKENNCSQIHLSLRNDPDQTTATPSKTSTSTSQIRDILSLKFNDPNTSKDKTIDNFNEIQKLSELDFEKISVSDLCSLTRNIESHARTVHLSAENRYFKKRSSVIYSKNISKNDRERIKSIVDDYMSENHENFLAGTKPIKHIKSEKFPKATEKHAIEFATSGFEYRITQSWYSLLLKTEGRICSIDWRQKNGEKQNQPSQSLIQDIRTDTYSTIHDFAEYYLEHSLYKHLE